MQPEKSQHRHNYLPYSCQAKGDKPSETFFCNCQPGGGGPISSTRCSCTSSATTYHLQPSSQLRTSAPRQHNMVTLPVQSPERYRDVSVQAKITSNSLTALPCCWY